MDKQQMSPEQEMQLISNQMHQLEETNRERLEHQEQVTSITSFTYRTLLGFFEKLMESIKENGSLKKEIHQLSSELANKVNECGRLRGELSEIKTQALDRDARIKELEPKIILNDVPLGLNTGSVGDELNTSPTEDNRADE